jgi:hypothetical protein
VKAKGKEKSTSHIKTDKGPMPAAQENAQVKKEKRMTK